MGSEGSSENYHYATMTRHPLNPLKILGEIKNDELSSWIRPNERVTCVSERLPLMISYNKLSLIHI